MPTLSALKLEPEDVLLFSHQEAQLSVTNVSDQHVAFKIKSTAPKCQFITPNRRTLPPGENAHVSIRYHTLDNFSESHRLLVQAVLVEGPEEIAKEAWSAFAKRTIQDHVLNVTKLDDEVGKWASALRFQPEGTLLFSHSEAQLSVKNVSGQFVAFKVKTTAPRSQLVTPSRGTLAPRENACISIKYHDPANISENHRLLVQAVLVDGPDEAAFEAWNAFAKDTIQETRFNIAKIDHEAGYDELEPNREQDSARPTRLEPEDALVFSDAELTSALSYEEAESLDEAVGHTSATDINRPLSHPINANLSVVDKVFGHTSAINTDSGHPLRESLLKTSQAVSGFQTTTGQSGNILQRIRAQLTPIGCKAKIITGVLGICLLLGVVFLLVASRERVLTLVSQNWHSAKYDVIVVDAFEAPGEYSPICDPSTAHFSLHNFQEVEDDGVTPVLFSAASILIAGMEALKALSALLGSPTMPFPSADDFVIDPDFPEDLSMRYFKANPLIKLGNLVPDANHLAKAGSMHWMTRLPEECSSFKALAMAIHHAAPKGRQSRAGLRLESATQTLWLRPQKIVGINLPWSVRGALSIFAAQFIYMFFSLGMTSWSGLPSYSSIAFDWRQLMHWIMLAMRLDMSLPILLKCWSIFINMKNFAIFLSGYQHASLVRRLTFACLIITALPLVIIYTISLSFIVGSGLLGLYLALAGCRRVANHMKWKQVPQSTLVAQAVSIMLAALAVNKACHHLTQETYLCPHSRLAFIKISGHSISIDPPLVGFGLSLLALSVASYVLLYFLTATSTLKFLEPIAMLVDSKVWYMRWMQMPVYNVAAKRIDPIGYCQHVEHFLQGIHPSCKYCNAILPTDAVIEGGDLAIYKFFDWSCSAPQLAHTIANNKEKVQDLTAIADAKEKTVQSNQKSTYQQQAIFSNAAEEMTCRACLTNAEHSLAEVINDYKKFCQDTSSDDQAHSEDIAEAARYAFNHSKAEFNRVRNMIKIQARKGKQLQVNYDELVQYTLFLEKEKKKVETENQNLKLDGPDGDLQVKYDELVQYTLQIEKEKKELETRLGKESSSSSSLRATSTTSL